MRLPIRFAVLAFVAFALAGVIEFQFSVRGTEAAMESGDSASVPVEDMVTMVDLGANECVPCKMMAPILEKLEKTYKGKAAIVFLDVWKDKAPAKRFQIRAIPTQIFFDKEGKEVYRHQGFMSESAIVSQLQKMGVD